MARRSAGILLFRRGATGVELLVVHPGGPLWARRDEGAWSIPKGEHGPDDDPYTEALREFAEEIGSPPRLESGSAPLQLGSVRLRSGKQIAAWALEGDVDETAVSSSTFELEWPPRSGRLQRFPEVDRAAWLDPEAARAKLNPAQRAFVDRLLDQL